MRDKIRYQDRPATQSVAYWGSRFVHVAAFGSTAIGDGVVGPSPLAKVGWGRIIPPSQVVDQDCWGRWTGG